MPKMLGNADPHAMSRSPDIAPLESRSRNLADLGGTPRRYFGARIEDGREVRIAVAEGSDERTGPVAEGKALAQFAADVNLLASLDHPNVPKVIEGLWLGDDGFAVVSECA